ncbi:hypothetical protein BpHYR1_004359 [Brachionus plicatilis]|uniref:Uncharacterized protein n=1 Tax=Brachionus plicatilis TaxID=10195 RepID=A0A3M7RKU2_BRAPC|nr:hypothetical protein BpHYR1_004359 [Brachionus plicatilis]
MLSAAFDIRYEKVLKRKTLIIKIINFILCLAGPSKILNTEEETYAKIATIPIYGKSIALNNPRGSCRLSNQVFTKYVIIGLIFLDMVQLNALFIFYKFTTYGAGHRI